MMDNVMKKTIFNKQQIANIRNKTMNTSDQNNSSIVSEVEAAGIDNDKEINLQEIADRLLSNTKELSLDEALSGLLKVFSTLTLPQANVVCRIFIAKAYDNDAHACALVCVIRDYCQFDGLLSLESISEDDLQQFQLLSHQNKNRIALQSLATKTLCQANSIKEIKSFIEVLESVGHGKNDPFYARIIAIGKSFIDIAKHDCDLKVSEATNSLNQRIRNLNALRKRVNITSELIIAEKKQLIDSLNQTICILQADKTELEDKCLLMSPSNLSAQIAELKAANKEQLSKIEVLINERDYCQLSSDHNHDKLQKTEKENSRLRKLLIRNKINPFPSGDYLQEAA